MTTLQFNERQVGNTDLSITTLGIGGAPFGNNLKEAETASVHRAIAAAYDVGIRYFDTAPFYGFGLSERRMGDALRGYDDIVLSTKVGRLIAPGLNDDPDAANWPGALRFHQVYDYGYDAVMRSVEDSYQRLGIDRIDILYLHDIGEFTHGAKANAPLFKDAMSGGYKALDELRRNGEIKAIGLGVNEAEVCIQALDHGQWDMFLLAGRYTLLEQGPLETLFPGCEKAGTTITIGGPFNSGILAGGKTFNYEVAPKDVVERVNMLQEICDDHAVPMGAAALQFPLGNPIVTSVVPGPRSDEDARGIIDWVNHEIPMAFWSDLRARNLLHADAPVPAGNPFLAG